MSKPPPPSASPSVDWDPLAGDVAALRRSMDALRERCPVARADVANLYPFWSVFGYEDVTRIARDTARFVNASPRLRGRRVPLESDPPEHTQIRRALQPLFMPAAIASLEPLVREYTEELVGALVNAGGGDAIASLARPLPTQALLALIGQPRSDWERVKRWSDEAYLQMSPDPAERARFVAADEALWRYSRSIVAERVAAPGDPRRDPVSALLQSAAVDASMPREELAAGLLRLLLAAGHDSTTSALGICMHFLAREPESQQALRAQPERIAAAIEEILRFESPVVMMPRTVATEVELHGRTLRAGDRVMLTWAAANRDPRAFESADRCVLDRAPNRHLVFGQGIHTCIGAPLARQELRIALERLLARTRRFELAGPVEYHAWQRFAPLKLPLIIE